MTTEDKLCRFVQSIADGDLRKDAPALGTVYRQGWAEGQADVQKHAKRLIAEIAKEK